MPTTISTPGPTWSLFRGTVLVANGLASEAACWALAQTDAQARAASAIYSTLQGPDTAAVTYVAPPAPAPAPPPPAPAPTTAPGVNWVQVAPEWTDPSNGTGQGSFAAQAGAVVRFGAGSAWVEKTLPIAGVYQCSAAEFGSDPAPGVGKVCELQVITAPAPAPTPAPAPAPPHVPVPAYSSADAMPGWIWGANNAGDALTLDFGVPDNGATSFAYQLLLNGAALGAPGTSTSRYLPVSTTAAQKGQVLSAQFTPSNAGGSGALTPVFGVYLN